MTDPRVDQYVKLRKLMQEQEFDPETPVVSTIFLGMSMQALEVELHDAGLLEVATNRFKDSGKEVHETRGSEGDSDTGESSG